MYVNKRKYHTGVTLIEVLIYSVLLSLLTVNSLSLMYGIFNEDMRVTASILDAYEE
jgi:type II secretory pathway component PulJ